MTLEDYNQFCASFLHSTYVVQWGGAHVWKIGGKVYAIGGWSAKDETPKGDEPLKGNVAVSFKCSEMIFEMYREAVGVRPAPYLASRGMKWLQRTHDDALSDKNLYGLIADSYTIVGSGLTKKLQRELGLLV